MRILGIDYGAKRIGVAICDELGITAQALAVIERKNKNKDFETIGNFIKTYGVEKIVIGYPLRLDGTAGIQCEKVDAFIRNLETLFSLPVIRWDEAFSTKEAEEIMREANIRIKKKKGVVDKIAAGMILQGYLDHLRKIK